MNNMNMKQMMERAKKMQAEMDRLKQEFDQREFVIEKQGITITMLGSKKIKSIIVNPALIDADDKDLLEDLMTVTFNAAIETVDEAEEEIKPQMPGGGMF